MSKLEESQKKPIFRNLNADDPEPETTEIESLCMNCHKNGITRLLLTKIPFYKELVLSSFSCEECGYENNEIQSGGQIAEKGIRITLAVKSPSDLNRQIIKSDYAKVSIVEIELEIPSKSQKGEITTIESILNRSIAGLDQEQETRRKEFPDIALKIDNFIAKLKELKEVKYPFTLIVEDISGDSFIENPYAPKNDPDCKVQHFKRTIDEDHELGIYDSMENEAESSDTAILHPIKEGEFTLEQLEGEVLHFPTNCTNCSSPCQTNMKMTNIPHFKDVVIMATTCDVCGHRTNEVKSGGGIEEKGLKIEVTVSESEDFSRDVLKAETCSLSIPELDLEVGPAALGGRFTTIEGLLVAMRDQITGQSRLFTDSQDPASEGKFTNYLEEYDKILKNKIKITLVLDDPAGNSYVQSMKDDQADERIKITRYERTYDQNEELGLNDMKTENYES